MEADIKSDLSLQGACGVTSPGQILCPQGKEEKDAELHGKTSKWLGSRPKNPCPWFLSIG